MRYVKILQEDLADVTKLYESVMSHACHGLFFREGSVYGARIVKEALKNNGDFFGNVKKILIESGWVEDISFGEYDVEVKGSFEHIPNAGIATCHRLRGIIKEVYETHYHKKVHCIESECVSMGNERCLFKVEIST